MAEIAHLRWFTHGCTLNYLLDREAVFHLTFLPPPPSLAFQAPVFNSLLRPPQQGVGEGEDLRHVEEAGGLEAIDLIHTHDNYVYAVINFNTRAHCIFFVVYM